MHSKTWDLCWNFCLISWIKNLLNELYCCLVHVLYKISLSSTFRMDSCTKTQFKIIYDNFMVFDLWTAYCFLHIILVFELLDHFKYAGSSSRSGLEQHENNHTPLMAQATDFSEELFRTCMRRFLYIRCYSSMEFLAALKAGISSTWYIFLEFSEREKKWCNSWSSIFT